MLFCEDCTVVDKQYNCEACDHNIGCQESAGRIDGPCGQQNCWYGCVVCENNHGCYHSSDHDED